MSRPSPSVSVVLAAYQAEQFLEEAIRSALAQRDVAVEVVVVDDGSTDGTLAIARRLAAEDDRVRVLTGPNRGAAAARNLAVQASTGTYLGLLDADDVWYPDKCARQVAALDGDPDLSVVGCIADLLSPTGQVLGDRGQRVGAEELDQVRAGVLMPVALSTMLLTRRTFDECGGFDGALAPAEDLDLLVRLTALGDLSVLPDRLGGYRVHGGSITTASVARQQAVGRYLQARAAGTLVDGEDVDAFLRRCPSTWRDRRVAVAARHHRLAGVALANGRRLPLVWHGAVAVLSDPLYVKAKLFQQRPRLRSLLRR